MYKFQTLLIVIFLLSCKSNSKELAHNFLKNESPDHTPKVYRADLTPHDKLIHKGSFSPSMQEYFYTISDKTFSNFNIYTTKYMEGRWSKAEKAFFNSQYSDHGTSFSPDGQSIYFSSNRPVNIEGVADTWHIWKVEKIHGEWQQPAFVDIPNLRNKLVSHPTVTNSGTIYFHSSNLDYSDMHIYQSNSISGLYTDAIKVPIPSNAKNGTCTPHVAPNEDYLIYASINEALDLMIAFKDESGNWKPPRKLNGLINHLGQGNPYVTPDHKYLFFTTGDNKGSDWSVRRINIESELKNGD